MPAPARQKTTPKKTVPGKAPQAATVPVRLSAAASAKDGLRVIAHRGDGSVLLAFNLDKPPQPGFAGFAVKCTPPSGAPFFLKNRLNFDDKTTASTTPADRRKMITTTDQAPYQKFRWVDFSSSLGPGLYKYEVSAMYPSRPGGPLQPRASTEVSLELGPFVQGKLQIGFTRGFLSSQAYVDRFQNKPFRPAKKSIDFDTAPFEAQYGWLGFHARKLVFDFLNECLADPASTLDVFAYDLDEPDVVRLLQKFKGRLRAVLDDAPLHTKDGAMEIEAHQLLVASAGAANVKQGHFKRFSHCKVFIQKKNGTPVRVLTGSANFSVRGFYVQANNVLVFDDPGAALQYETAFEESFHNMSQFSSSEVAEGWIDIGGASVAFSPHRSADVSLGRVADAIKNAKSSVLFAIMDLGGSGPVLSQIQSLTQNRPGLFSYGVTQTLSGAKVFKPGSPDGILTSFSYLSAHVPPPFDAEISGGMGQVIHDKFVVVDFDTDHPSVFTGSSNLAAGGEEANGDNLLAISDPAVAGIFAVQALGLVDHFHFRALMQSATNAAPLTLSRGDWWKDYFTKGTLKFRDRNLFCP